MAWRDNPIGIVIDGWMAVDFVAAKKAGIAYVVAYCGMGYEKADQGFPSVVQACYDAGLPVLARFIQMPAIDDYTQAGVPAAQIPFLQKILANKKFHALVLDISRYCTGYDLENGHAVRVATDANISTTASEIVNTMTKALAPLSINVLVAGNNDFIMKYAPSVANWLDKFGFDLVDNRYRLPNSTNGDFDRYITYGRQPILKNSLEELRLSLPPIEAKNPLVPGNAPQLKFWECSGTRFMLPFVRDHNGVSKAVTVSLWNGSIETLYKYLNFGQISIPVPDTQPPAQVIHVLASADAHSVTLTWDAAIDDVGVDHYRIYRDGTLITDGLLSPVYTDGALLSGKNYKYVISALDRAGNESAYSTTCSAYTLSDPPVPVTPPVDLTPVLDKLAALETMLEDLQAQVYRIGIHFK